MVDLSEEELVPLIQLLNAQLVESQRKDPEAPFPQLALYHKLLKARHDNLELMNANK